MCKSGDFLWLGALKVGVLKSPVFSGFLEVMMNVEW
jgi:hypothetical protein